MLNPVRAFGKWIWSLWEKGFFYVNYGFLVVAPSSASVASNGKSFTDKELQSMTRDDLIKHIKMLK